MKGKLVAIVTAFEVTREERDLEVSRSDRMEERGRKRRIRD